MPSMYYTVFTIGKSCFEVAFCFINSLSPPKISLNTTSMSQSWIDLISNRKSFAVKYFASSSCQNLDPTLTLVLITLVVYSSIEPRQQNK